MKFVSNYQSCMHIGDKKYKNIDVWAPFSIDLIWDPEGTGRLRSIDLPKSQDFAGS